MFGLDVFAAELWDLLFGLCTSTSSTFWPCVCHCFWLQDSHHKYGYHLFISVHEKVRAFVATCNILQFTYKKQCLCSLVIGHPRLAMNPIDHIYKPTDMIIIELDDGKILTGHPYMLMVKTCKNIPV